MLLDCHANSARFPAALTELGSKQNNQNKINQTLNPPVQLHLGSQQVRHAWEGEPHKHNARPVDEGADDNCGGTRTLKEELRRDQKWNRAWSEGEEEHNRKGRRHEEDADAGRGGVQVKGDGEEDAGKVPQFELISG